MIEHILLTAQCWYRIIYFFDASSTGKADQSDADNSVESHFPLGYHVCAHSALRASIGSSDEALEAG